MNPAPVAGSADASRSAALFLLAIAPGYASPISVSGRLGRPARSGDSFTDSEPGAMAERRPERVAHLVQAELATVFLREANDPRLRDLTVTAVRMSADLRVARVYVRTLGDTVDARAAALRALARAATFLRGRVGRALGRSEEHTSELQSPCNLV